MTDPDDAHWDSTSLDAFALVHGDRGALYGHPAEDYARTVALFELMTGHSLTAAEGVVFMKCMKLSRLATALEGDMPPEAMRDTIVDDAGYGDCLWGVLTYESPAEEDEEG